MVRHNYNPSKVQGQPPLYCEIDANLGYKRPRLRTQTHTSTRSCLFGRLLTVRWAKRWMPVTLSPRKLGQ